MQRIEQVDFYGDPSCPWTYMAFLWLESLRDDLSFLLHYRPISLAVINNVDVTNTAHANLMGSFFLKLVEISRTLVNLNDLFMAIASFIHQQSGTLVPLEFARFSKIYDLDLSNETLSARLDEIHNIFTTEISEFGNESIAPMSPMLRLLPTNKLVYGPVLSSFPANSSESSMLLNAFFTLAGSSDFYEFRKFREKHPSDFFRKDRN